MTALLRRTLYWAGYGLLLALVSLAALEGAVRLLGLAPRLPNQYRLYAPDPVLSHRLRPGTVVEGRSATDEFDFRYAHNAHGLRDREISLAKPEGTFRVLALGDSFTYGAGVDFEDTFLARLERRLAERDGEHPPVQVVKAGIPRFFPETERLYLEHYGAAFDPDLVLVVFVPNDVIDTHMGLDAIRVLPDGRLVSNYGARLLARLGPTALFVYERLHVARIPMRWYLQTQVANESPARWDEVFRDGGHHEDDWQEVERQYAMMVDWARERDARVAFVHVPLQGPWQERDRYPAKRLATFAERAGVAFIDVLPAMERKDPEARLYWPLDRHPTAEGHAVVADELQRELVARGLVP